MTDAEKEDAFREALAALYREHGLRLNTCSCCGLWIEPTTHDMQPHEVDQ